MGQAKQRGTYEQRRSSAIARRFVVSECERQAVVSNLRAVRHGAGRRNSLALMVALAALANTCSAGKYH